VPRRGRFRREDSGHRDAGNNMKVLKARMRLFGGSQAAAILVTLTVGAVVYTQMRTIDRTAARITRDTLPSIYLSGKLESVTLLRYTLLTDYVDPANEEGKAELDRQIDSANTQIDDAMRKYEALIDSPTDRKLFNELKAARRPYDECFTRTLDLVRKGDREDAQVLIGTQLILERNDFLQAAEAEVVWNKADADDSASAITRAMDWTSTGVLLCLVFSAGVALIALGNRRRMEAELKLKESEERFREVFERAPVGICVAGPNGRYVQVNDAFCRMVGYTGEELVSKSWLELCHPDEVAFALEKKQQLWMDPAGRTDVEGRYIHKNGSVVWTRMKVSLIRGANGAAVYSVIHVEDITERRQAEQALKESEERFRVMADNCPIGIWVTDAHGEAGFINKAYREFSGAASGHVDQSEWESRIHQEDASEFLEKFHRAHREHAIFKSEQRSRRRDGEWRWMESLAAPRFSSSGEFLGLVGTTKDITERRQAEQATRDSREFAQSTIDALSSHICVLDETGVIIAENQAWKDFGEANKPEHCAQAEPADAWRGSIGEGANYLDVCRRSEGEDSAEARDFADGIEAVLKGERNLFSREYPCHSPKVQRWFLGRATRFFSNGVPRVVVEHINITERKQAEDALRESDKRFRVMADGCPTPIWVTDAQGGIQFTNRAFREFCGAPHEHLDGHQWKLLIHPEDLPEFFRETERAVRTRTTLKAEARVQRSDGEWRWIIAHTEPRFSPQGEFLGHAGLSTDITERKQAELALKNSEEKFRQLAENIREVFWMMNAAGTEILYVGPAYEQIWGRTCESLYARPMDWLEAIHPDDRAGAHETFMRQLQGETIDSEYRITTADGMERWIRDRAFPVRDQDGQMIRVAGIAEDVTERKRAEQILRNSEEKFRQLAENIHEVFFVMTPEGAEVLYISPAFEEVWERSLESIYLNPMSWVEAIHPDDREQAHLLAARQLLGELVVLEYRIRTPDGKEKWIRARCSPIHDETGALIRVVGIAEEITERKRYEAELIRARQEADAASAVKSEFLANMSHEIRTPMNGVIGMTGLLLDTELTAGQRRYAEIARASGESLLQIINDILDFSKIEAKKLELDTIDFNLLSLLDNLASVLSATAEAKGIELLSFADAAVPTQLRGDPGRLRQILTNLTGNAIKFTEKGEVVVRVAVTEQGESDCLLRFSVRDTGIGIAEDKIGIVFDKFSQAEASTTRKYGGTGLGLAISKQLVELMGGEVGVTSQEGAGSEFWFTVRLGRSLGLASQSEAALTDSQATALLNARILLAEDSETNREVALGMLANLGLTADAVGNGAEALAALEAATYDLVLMDVRMPVMDGIEATRRIRDRRSAVLNREIPIVAMTANAMNTDRERCLAAGMNDFVPKPVSKPVLRDALKRWLRPPDDVAQAAAKPMAYAQPVPPQAKEGDAVVFDRAGVLQRLEGDCELASAIMEVFLDDLPRQIESLKDLIARRDANGAGHQAHSIKGAAANVGGERMRRVALEMETSADAGNLTGVACRMGKLETEFRLLKDALEHESPSELKI